MAIDLKRIFKSILQFKSKIQLEQVYNIFISFIILLILVLGLLALNRPISVEKFHNVLKISEQQNCPESQSSALALSQQREIKMGQYLKLMHAYHTETERAHQLPAQVLEQP